MRTVRKQPRLKDEFLAAGVRAFLAKRGPFASSRGGFVVPLTYKNTFMGIIAFEGGALRKVTESELRLMRPS